MELISDQNWLLSVGTFAPLVGVAIMLYIPRGEEQLHKQIALITALVTFAFGVYTLFQFDYDQAQALQFYADHEWISVIHSNYTIGLDGISLPLYVLSSFITLVVIIYTYDDMPDAGNPKSFLILMLILQVGMAGTFI